MDKIERIVKDSIVYAIVIRSNYNPKKTEFFTENEHLQQLGFIVYKTGSIIQPHIHKPMKRVIEKTTETLIIKKGKVEYHIFDNGENIISTGLLNKGDAIALLNGGHGFKVIEDAIMLEVKQGPYISTEKDKKRFK